MYVIVGIASYNEADSIAGVVRAADQGLLLLAREFPDLRALILNADSNSPDGTTREFLGAPTSWDKKAITTAGEPGKGKNVLAMIALAEAERADCLLMLDGDVRSAEPEWIVRLVRPVLQDIADFVTPRYERSLYDGAITNHFAWPLLLSVFGRDIQQPIAGDFALGRRLLGQVRQDATPIGVPLRDRHLFDADGGDAGFAHCDGKSGPQAAQAQSSQAPHHVPPSRKFGRLSLLLARSSAR